jgi:hypothetical protein
LNSAAHNKKPKHLWFKQGKSLFLLTNKWREMQLHKSSGTQVSIPAAPHLRYMTSIHKFYSSLNRLAGSWVEKSLSAFSAWLKQHWPHLVAATAGKCGPLLQVAEEWEERENTVGLITVGLCCMPCTNTWV